MTANPYLLPVPAQGNSPMSQARRLLEPMIAQHMEGFGEALTGLNPKDPIKRVRAHTMMRIGLAAANQSRHVALEYMRRSNPLALISGEGVSLEAALNNSTLQASITSFITQMIHMSLSVYPRLISNQLVSVQPFTQPSGYIFYLKRVEKNNGGGDDGRDLSDLSTFNSTYSNRTAEGDQVKAVGTTLEKELVEVQYQALMHQNSHEVDVAMRTQYGLDLEQLGDIATAEELAWEVDRQVVDAVVAYAETNPLGIAYFDDTRNGTYDGLTPSEQQAYDQEFVRRTMTEVAIDMAGKIYRTPNWHICGLSVSKLLARTPDALAEKVSPAMYDQIATRGSIIQSGRMRDGAVIWTDPQLDADTMVSGFVDNMNPFYAGYAFCPFGAASILTAAFMDPDTLLRKKSRALAFAKKGINPNQFRVTRLGTGS
jgi:hypothetical protein